MASDSNSPPSPCRVLVVGLEDVVFDCDVRRMIQRAVARTRPEIDPQLLQSLVEKWLSGDSWQKLLTGSIDETSFLIDVMKRTEPAERVLLLEFVKQRADEVPVMAVMEGGAEAVRLFHAEGVELVSVSNLTWKQFKGLEHCYPELMQLFTKHYTSNSSNEAKPHPSLFNAVADRHRQAQVLFVCTSEADYAAARSVAEDRSTSSAIDCVLISDPTALLDALPEAVLQQHLPNYFKGLVAPQVHSAGVLLPELAAIVIGYVV